MKVLVACEESQTVCKAFRERGHEAYSCDIIDCSGGHPEWHILGDVLEVINPKTTHEVGLYNQESDEFYGIIFKTMDGEWHVISGKWDLIIAHPPCTDLAVSGAAWFKEKQKDGRQQKSIVFFMQMALADCERIAVENPVCIMSSAWRKPDQIIQPYQFGHNARKKTCLWLKGLPKLVPTNIVDPGEIRESGHSVGAHADGRDENGRWLRYNSPEIKKLRSKTFQGIGEAMAEQWGCL